jgi:hypothetical protein
VDSMPLFLLTLRTSALFTPLSIPLIHCTVPLSAQEGKQGPRVDSIYGIHLWSVTALGNVLCSEGPVMAASDKVRGALQRVFVQ